MDVKEIQHIAQSARSTLQALPEVEPIVIPELSLQEVEKINLIVAEQLAAIEVLMRTTAQEGGWNVRYIYTEQIENHYSERDQAVLLDLRGRVVALLVSELSSQGFGVKAKSLPVRPSPVQPREIQLHTIIKIDWTSDRL